jgi:energy-coupling factor transport system permease/ATP-binding protein
MCTEKFSTSEDALVRPLGRSSSAMQNGITVDAASSAASPAVIRFKDWGYRHASRRHFAVRGLNLTIEAGQRVLLLGASGIGKSTILEAAAGLLGAESADSTKGEKTADQMSCPNSPVAIEDSEGGMTEGTVLVDDMPAGRARGRVGLVLQDPEAQTIFERLGDNVAFGPENMGLPRDNIWPVVRESLVAVGLEGLQLHRSTMHLSGGQMQRLALAGALAMRPGALLLDEPTANLDPQGVTQVVDAVRHVLDITGSTMLLVEHRAGPWIDMIDRVVVLGLESDEQRDSRIKAQNELSHNDSRGFRRTVVVADGSPDEVFRDPALDFASLGIWVPKRYQRPRDTIERIHSEDEPQIDPSVGTGQVLLSARDLSIGRNGKAIASHINVSFNAGQITALVGQNGAGKSTLSLTLAGLLEPVAGRIVAAPSLAEGVKGGDDPMRWRSTELAARISYVFQNPEHQFARGTVLDEVMLGLIRIGVPNQEAKLRGRELLERFSLSQYASVNPYTLSGGEKRRLTVAAALAASPRVIILDEPTFGQDRRTWTEIVELIHSLRGDGVSIIVVTHDSELVTALGARVVELETVGSIDAGSSTNVMSSQYTEPSQFDLPNISSKAPSHPSKQHLSNESVASGKRDGAIEAGTYIAVSPVEQRGEAVRATSRSPFLSSLNPAFRLIGGFLIAVPMILSLDWVSASLALGIEFVLLLAIGFSPLRVVKSSWPVWIGAPGSALAVLLYGKSGGYIWWQWGMIQITSRSAWLALATGIRILAIGVPAIIVVLGIETTDLADSFSQILHLPDRFVYGGLAGMRLFSVLRDDWAALTASRRSRGLGDENKVKAFFPQAFALLVLSIRRSTMLATAMEARGFGADTPRTHARVSVANKRDWVFVTICLSIPVVSMLSAWLAGTFVFFGG